MKIKFVILGCGSSLGVPRADGNWDSDSHPTEMSFYVVPAGDSSPALSQKMVIQNNGNVGIGTNDPASKLDVRGTVQVGVDDTGHDVKFFGATSGNYMLWDQSGDELAFVGATKISFFDAAGGENIVGTSDGHLEINS